MSATTPADLTPSGRRLILTAGFLGWLCAGLQMGLGPLASRSAAIALLFPEYAESGRLPREHEALAGAWTGWLLAAFLLGGALGGFLFGRVGDRQGRVRALGWSILCYAGFSGVSAFVASLEQLLALRFLVGLGIGGAWPAAVALVSEAWPAASRPAIAGVLGAAANVGILALGLFGHFFPVTPLTWRYAMFVCAAPVLLGGLVLAFVPESPRWLAARSQAEHTPWLAVFRPPLLSRTLIGIGLGTVPLVGTWASGKWIMPWAQAEAGSHAQTQAWWAFGAVLGSAFGGWIASLIGRRVTYFLVSLGALSLNLLIFRTLHPAMPAFLPVVFLLGLVATVFFGWLPLYLPELYPTRVRSTGTGVTYNAGRFVTTLGVLGTSWLMTVFEGDYARVGEVAAWVYGLGMVIILFAPDTRRLASLEAEAA